LIPGILTGKETVKVTPEDIANLFLTMVPAYQIEEMICVRDYIFDKLSEVFVEVQQELSKDPAHFVEVSPFGEPIQLPPGFEAIPEPKADFMNPEYDGCVDLSPEGMNSIHTDSSVMRLTYEDTSTVASKRPV